MTQDRETSACCWCWKKVLVLPNYDDRTQKVFCSVGCRDAERLFVVTFSDENITKEASRGKAKG